MKQVRIFSKRVKFSDKQYKNIISLQKISKQKLGKVVLDILEDYHIKFKYKSWDLISINKLLFEENKEIRKEIMDYIRKVVEQYNIKQFTPIISEVESKNPIPLRKKLKGDIKFADWVIKDTSHQLKKYKGLKKKAELKYKLFLKKYVK